MQRILVTGNAGSGKTSVAQVLAAHMRLPYIGLDGIVWKPGWVATPKSERHERESRVSAGSAWVVDGVSTVILEAADCVVFLDYPRHKCYRRALWRNIPYLFRSRPGLPERCPEVAVIPTLIKLIWRFPKRVRPAILEACQGAKKTIVHIRSDEELKMFFISIGATPPSQLSQGSIA